MPPLYCETPTLLASFPLEPVNTWSNVVIIALGVLALALIAKRPAKRGNRSLWLLGCLLLATGFGSFLWHGWRTQAFLALDALPGGLFLLTAVYLWLRRFYAGWPAFFVFLGFVALEGLSITYGGQILKSNMIFVSVAPVIIVLGAWLIARTYGESLRAAALGGGALLLTMVALIFRSIDLAVCDTFPIGTHFLWHILLSLAALLIVLMFIIIDYGRLLTAPLPQNRMALRADRRAPPSPPSRPTLHV